MTKKKLLAMFVSLFLVFGFLAAACSDKADVASENLSKAADNFEINRRIVFVNAITDTYLLSIEGFCSIDKDNEDNQLEVTCDVGGGQFKKHFLGISDNVTYFVEQLESAGVSTDNYRVIFRPQTIVPDIEVG